MVSWIPRTMYSPLIPQMTNDLQLTYAEGGLLMTGFWLGYVMTQIPSGYLSDRIGVRYTHAGALVLIGIMSILTGIASSFAECFAYRILCGLAAGCIFAPGSAIVLRWFQSKRRDVATSFFVASSRIGGMVGLILSPAISTFFGSWRWSFWILSSVAFFAAIAVILFAKESPEKRSVDKSVGKERRPSEPSKYRAVFKNKLILLLILANCGHFLAYSAIITWAPTYLIGNFGVSPVQAGLILSVFSGLGILGIPLGAILADRFVDRKGQVIFFSFLTLGIGCSMISFFPGNSILPIMVMLILVGVTGSMGIGITVSILSEWFPLNVMGTASGLLNLSTLGGSLSPYLFGAIVDATATFSLGWIVSGSISIVLIMFMIPIVHRQRN